MSAPADEGLNKLHGITDQISNELPQNIKEFNEIVLVVFSQLYKEHPVEKTLDLAEIAAVIGVSPTDVLPSGRSFDKVFDSTMQWLRTQGFTHGNASYAHERATLTARGLAAMNALPQAVGTMPSTTGAVLVQAEQAASRGDRKQLVELAGSFIGSIIKSALGG
jgi:hypothetical protein